MIDHDYARRLERALKRSNVKAVRRFVKQFDVTAVYLYAGVTCQVYGVYYNLLRMRPILTLISMDETNDIVRSQGRLIFPDVDPNELQRMN